MPLSRDRMPGTRVRNRSIESAPILPVPTVPGKAPTWVRPLVLVINCGKTVQRRLCQSPSPWDRAECLRLAQFKHASACVTLFAAGYPRGCSEHTRGYKFFMAQLWGWTPTANVGGGCLCWAPTFASAPVPRVLSPRVPPNPTGSPAAFPRHPSLSVRGLGRLLILSFPLPDTPTFLSATRQCGQG